MRARYKQSQSSLDVLGDCLADLFDARSVDAKVACVRLAEFVHYSTERAKKG